MKEMFKKRVSPKNISIAKDIRKKVLTWSKIDSLLYNEFNKYDKNTDINDVGYKIVILDRLYNCNLKIDISKVTSKFITLDIDEKLSSNDAVDLVNQLANLNFTIGRKDVKQNRRIGLVFASKYCHFHKPERFPIYDRYVRIALAKLFCKKTSEYEWNYKSFKDDVDIIKKSLGARYKELDEYLWLYGQWIRYRECKKNELSNEILYAIKSNVQSFSELEPI